MMPSIFTSGLMSTQVFFSQLIRNSDIKLRIDSDVNIEFEAVIEHFDGKEVFQRFSGNLNFQSLENDFIVGKKRAIGKVIKAPWGQVDLLLTVRVLQNQ